MEGITLWIASEQVDVLKGHALQLAEKLVRAVGPGFIPDISTIKSSRALASEVCFSGFRSKAGPFPQPV
jgi:hypothetical protein